MEKSFFGIWHQYVVDSYPVLAFNDPPVDSIGEVTSKGDGLFLVPLKSICSKKWATTCSSMFSSLDPALMDIDIATDSALGMLWVTIRNPEVIVDFSCLIKRIKTLCYRVLSRISTPEISQACSTVIPFSNSISLLSIVILGTMQLLFLSYIH